MKKYLSFIIAGALITSVFSISSCASSNNKTIILQVDNPIMTVNGTEKEIDSGYNTTPIVENNRVLLPIRSIIEEVGGNVEWDSNTQTVSLNYNNNNVQLKINSSTAILNNKNIELDTKPIIIKGRTMLPLRFIAESFGFGTEWDSDTKSITITKDSEDVTISQTETTEAQSVAPKENSKILIVYFSRAENIELNDNIDAVSSASLNTTNNGIEGNTKVIADMIQNEVGGDVYSIQTKEYYPTEYRENVNIAKNEQNSSARPKIKTKINNFDQYNTIFIGYPIWWSTIPMPVYTFLDEYDFDGKTVIPFSTHKGSGMGSSQIDIKKALPKANVIDGFTIEGDNAVNAIDQVKDSISKLDLKGNN
ncbi:MAG: flavodoxin [Lachnospirales bacterium]